MIKVILFDLDGTLLPMDQDIFAKAYFGGLSKKAAPYGYESKELVKTIWGGTAAMVKNNGETTNEEVFWKYFCSKYGEDAFKDKAIFDNFYENEFANVKNVCGFNPEVKPLIAKLKQKGYRLALATNPIFPEIATRSRVEWAGLSISDFELFTTYENSNCCKPNLEYYIELLKKLNVSAEECLMVGNDVDEDMIAEKLGIKVFLITDCLINKSGRDTSGYKSGSFKDLIEYLA